MSAPLQEGRIACDTLSSSALVPDPAAAAASVLTAAAAVVTSCLRLWLPATGPQAGGGWGAGGGRRAASDGKVFACGCQTTSGFVHFYFVKWLRNHVLFFCAFFKVRLGWFHSHDNGPVKTVQCSSASVLSAIIHWEMLRDIFCLDAFKMWDLLIAFA